MNKWPKTPLKSHITEVSVRKGATPSEILSVTNSNGFVRSLDVFDKQVFSQDCSNYKLVGHNDLAYNPSRINVGSVALCQFPEGGAVSPMYVVVRCRKTLLPQFLHYFLKSDVGRQNIEHHCAGAVRFQLRFSDLERIEIPIPPLREQQCIVQILDEVEAVRRLRVQADERASQLVRTLFTELFGDPVTNTKGWPTSTVGNELSLLEYGPRFYNESYSVTGTRIVRITDLDNVGNFDFANMPMLEVNVSTLTARSLQPGDLIFARSGATVGKVALVPDNAPTCIAGAYFIRMRFNDELNPTFALELLRSAAIQDIISRQSKQAAQPNFSGPLIRALPLILPPISFQRAFATRVAGIRTLQSAQTASRERLDDLSQALLYRAFQGEL
ncbi:MAG: restriction endonuclease subunit S [Desulfuromonadales bacterium]|nr:restriction endonuclease subunit S [Desulfuromonadales bacterium]